MTVGRIFAVAALVGLGAAWVLHAPPLVVFALAVAAILPLAGEMGHATEAVAARLGSTAGGLLNATCGNAAELIIAFAALRRGPEMVPIVEASITGSIIGNILLVFGLAALVGGWGVRRRTFDRNAASAAAVQLAIGASALLVPAVFAFSTADAAARLPSLSVGVAAVLLVAYGLGLVSSLKTHPRPAEPAAGPPPPARRAGVALALSAAGVGLASEALVHSVEEVAVRLGLFDLFVGIVVVAVVGNAAEHSTAIWAAARGKTDLAVEIAIGSSVQIALFVAPVLVIAAAAMGVPLTLAFTPLEVVAVAVAVGVTAMITLDGETNWLEGAMLLCLYAILAIAFSWA